MKQRYCLRRVTALVTASTGLALVAGAPAFAAEDSARDSTEQAAMIEAVVVTAQHRKEKLQEVPLSVQVIDGQVQSEQNLNSIEALTQTAPAIHLGSSSRTSDMYIRGIGSGNNPSFDQSVGLFIDNIYHGRSRTTAATFMDLERVEVLKGPQSTFFGNNAIAGAINIVARRPDQEFGGSARLFFGRFGQYTAEAAGGGALSETLSARVAIIADGMKGWMHNVHLSTDAPNTDNLAGRVTFLFEPNADFDATWKIEASDNSNRGAMPIQIENCPPAAPATVRGACDYTLAQGLPVGIGSNQFAVGPEVLANLNTRESALTLNWRRGGHTFTSVTGFYKYDYVINADPDGTPAVMFSAHVPERYHQFSQEFRVASPTNQPIEYLGGVYFHSGKLSANQDTHFYFLSPVINSAPPFAGLRPFVPLGQNWNFVQKEKVGSVFGSVSWNATDRLKLTAGLRGSRVKKDLDGALFYGTAVTDYGSITPWPDAVQQLAIPLGLGAPHTKDASRTDEGWMPSAKIQYSINPASMVYVSYNRGIKEGGFNGIETTGIASRLPYGPETVDAYEIGLKNEWDEVLLNLAVFRSDYSDLQVSANIPAGSGTFVNITTNAASAVSQGVEVQGQWAVTPNLRLAVDATYLDAHYVSFPGGAVTMAQQLAGLRVQDLSGRPTQFAPEWTTSLTGTYRTHLPNEWRMTAELRGYLSSSYFLMAQDDPMLAQGRYTRLDGRLTLETPNHDWAFDLIGQNLTNTTIMAFRQNLVTSPGTTVAQKQMPRSIGLQARYNF